jgi:hypothetical protein
MLRIISFKGGNLISSLGACLMMSTLELRNVGDHKQTPSIVLQNDYCYCQNLYGV